MEIKKVLIKLNNSISTIKLKACDGIFNISKLKQVLNEKFNLRIEDFYLLENNRIVNNQNILKSNHDGVIYNINIKIKGGKGGFGSLLKGQPAVKKRTKNFDSCRDLSGKRIRHIIQEKKIQDYLINKKDEDEKIQQYLEPSNKISSIPKTKLLELNKQSIDFQNDENLLCQSITSSIEFLKKKIKNTNQFSQYTVNKQKDIPNNNNRNNNNLNLRENLFEEL